MKKVYLVALILLISFNSFAVDYSDKAVKSSTAFNGTLEQYYPLEIELKDDGSASVDITSKDFDGKEKITKLKFDQLRVGRLNYKEINLNTPVTIEITGKGIKKNYHMRYILDPTVKTAYLKIENGKLLPRVGSFIGSKTPSGLSVKNNITAKQIHLIK